MRRRRGEELRVELCMLTLLPRRTRSLPSISLHLGLGCIYLRTFIDHHLIPSAWFADHACRLRLGSDSAYNCSSWTGKDTDTSTYENLATRENEKDEERRKTNERREKKRKTPRLELSDQQRHSSLRQLTNQGSNGHRTSRPQGQPLKLRHHFIQLRQ